MALVRACTSAPLAGSHNTGVRLRQGTSGCNQLMKPPPRSAATGCGRSCSEAQGILSVVSVGSDKGAGVRVQPEETVCTCPVEMIFVGIDSPALDQTKRPISCGVFAVAHSTTRADREGRPVALAQLSLQLGRSRGASSNKSTGGPPSMTDAPSQRCIFVSSICSANPQPVLQGFWISLPGTKLSPGPWSLSPHGKHTATGS